MTEIITVDQLEQDYPVFDPEMLEENEDRESVSHNELTVIKTPGGGGTVWEWSDSNGDHSSKSLDGILVYKHKYYVLWPYDEIGHDTRPYLVSFDGMKGYRTGEQDIGELDATVIGECMNDDGSVNWMQLPYSAPGGRAKEQRHLYLLLPGNLLPIKVVVQPGSLRNVKLALANMNPPINAPVSLTLAKAESKDGITYSQINMRVTGKLDRSHRDVLREAYTNHLRESAKAELEGLKSLNA